MWFHPETGARLGNLLEIPPARVGEAMGNDACQAWVNNNYAMEGIVHERDGESHTDYWGIHWVKDGAFNQIDRFPLADEAELDAVRAYPFPYQHQEDLLRQMEPVARNAGERFLGCDISPCGFEMYWRLRGMENALMDFADDPEFAAEMVGHCADFAIALGEAACDRFPLDWLWTGDDVASQTGMMMSPETWRRIVRPHLQRVFDVGRKRGLWVAYHCCGALRSIIGDLVEMGLDVLNPVQCNCPGMDAVELKREFGGQLAFMGGVDTQDMLPNGSVDDVRRATRNLLDIMAADGGGYILAASHTIPPETPDANIFAMYAEAGVTREEIFDRAADIRRSLPRETVCA
ncbi:MAG: uroporphyrinogen decarboxylase family protein [Terrimicrobiaceae bacterium]|nr:uroporphyrinogen decarboxylase family protein [Terrimicrobiaceae bacterium]